MRRPSTITVGNSPDAVAFSPNGKRAYVTSWADDTVSVINVKAGNRGRANRYAVGDHPEISGIQR